MFSKYGSSSISETWNINKHKHAHPHQCWVVKAWGHRNHLGSFNQKGSGTKIKSFCIQSKPVLEMDPREKLRFAVSLRNIRQCYMEKGAGHMRGHISMFFGAVIKILQLSTNYSFQPEILTIKKGHKGDSTPQTLCKSNLLNSIWYKLFTMF